MKKYLGLAVLVATASTTVLASKARLEALGEDTFGSYYVEDNRNMFLNAAEVNNHYDFVSLDAGSAASTNHLGDTVDSPRASGGVFKKAGKYVYGAYFGQNSNTATSLRLAPLAGLAKANAATYGAAYVGVRDDIDSTNEVELFIGSESSVKWGAKLQFSKSSNEQSTTATVGNVGTVGKIEQQAALLGLGMISGDWTAIANISLANKAKIENFTATGKDYDFQGKLGYQIGVSKKLGGNRTVYFEHRSITVEEKDLMNEEWKISRFDLGYGTVYKLSDSAKAFVKLNYYSDKQDGRAFSGKDYNESFLKATVAMESKATSWLTLRGSISNNLIGETEDDGKKATIADAVGVALGASLTFGDLSLDGFIGNDKDGNGTTGDANGVIRTDSLLSRVSMTYKF